MVMQKPEKSAEPSMDEILASIRKIIAEEPTPSDKPVNQADPSPATVDGGAPPNADLSDILDEPAQRGPTNPAPAEQGLTEWTFSNPASRGTPPPDAPSSNPFAGQEVDKIDVVDVEPESPLVARLRDLATGGSGSASAEPVAAQDAPASPPDAATVDPVSALAE